ncbi:MAG: molybdopterin-dependent oxidoreductase [Alphaproteobacteria bacterium]|nr:molybdopterin-dependent oxidoreductase [Alphaproteobacteria bacterium]
MSRLTRRGLLAKGTLVVAFSLARGATAQEGGKKSLPLDSWIRIDAEGQVTVFTGKAELGQGLKTALIQIAADQLAVSPDSIDLVTADTALTPDEGITAGSRSMQDSGTAILNAAANVRLLLAEAAAWRLVMSADRVVMRDGAAHGTDGRSITYAELVTGLSLHVEAKADAPRRAERQVIGTNLPRVDIPAKLSGGTAYLQDFRMAGMLHARVVRGPGDGTRLKPTEVEAVSSLPGIVRVVRDGRFVAVLATDEWRAVKALHRLQAAGWERPERPVSAADEEELPIFETAGPAPQAGGTVVSAHYSRPWLMHGAIGPSCAVALWENDSLTVWTHSQGVGPLRKALAELVRLAPEQVRCIHVEGSGCYGHNGADDVAADAALAARAMPGLPVRLQWMREQEHGWEPLGSAMAVGLQATLGTDGRVSTWQHDVWSNPHSARPTSAGGLLAGAEVDPPFPSQKVRPIPMPEGGGSRNANPLYVLPNSKGIHHFAAEAPVRVSALRSLGAHMNIFAIESFMDELAKAAGADPITFRLGHLQDERARAVVQAAANRFGWAARQAGSDRRGCGFAFARYKNLAAYCAVAMEVAVDRTSGAIQVSRVVAAVDSGEAINPDGIRNQIEGGIVQSLSWTIHEAVAVEGTHRRSFDWSAYPILRFADAPASIEVHVIDRPGQPFLGTGEAAQGPAAAALANAVADAIGVRLRDMPLSRKRVKAALST